MKFKKISPIKLLLVFSAVIPLFLASSSIISAQDENLPVQAGPDINVYFFRGEGCPHCAEEEKFLDEIKGNYPDLKVRDYEVYYNRKNQKLFKEVADKLGAKSSAVPFTVIGDSYFIGFSRGQTAGPMEEKIRECSISFCPSPVDGLLLENGGSAEVEKKPLEIPEKINFPLIGEITTKNFSLPFLTFIFGALDGFNPCAMWILIFLIGILLGMENKKRMWALGIVFLVASAMAYYAFMAAWLNLVLFIGFIVWIRILIGLLALGGGVYSLRDYFKNKDAICEVGDAEQKGKIAKRLTEAVKKEKFWLALVGVAAVAFGVNLLELVCSAGLPVIYTQILIINGLSGFQYYAYLLLYVFIFMLDDLIVFSVAMLALKPFNGNSKYSRLSRLIGGIIMALIGLIMIFWPELLMFG
jgi:glutaredoxin